MTLRSKYFAGAVLTALSPFVPLAAHAQDANTVRALAATCSTCHGTDGRSVGGVPPSLAGRPKVELQQMLLDFKNGKRPATVMHQQAKGYTDAQLEQIAGYFASVPASAGSAAPARSGY